MKALLQFVAWMFVAAVMIYAAARPDFGVVFQNPICTVGVGLIGLGMIVDARKRIVAEEAKKAPATSKA
ncbi:MAG: hypothetical protein IT440_10500 [Phycisphaeraceae bacterium]|nr:hypothetical protein [Phycisphaeraceae bacterium]